MLLWDPVTEEWEPLPGWDPYGRDWWFEVIPGAWANVRIEHFKHWRGRLLACCRHPRLPGRWLGCLMSP